MEKRTNPGVYHEMKERMAVETEPFTLFDVALNQFIPTDVRRAAANRLNDLHHTVVFGYLKSIAEPELLVSIGRSGMFPTTITTFAKGRAKAMRATDETITKRLIAAMEQQNKLLNQLANYRAKAVSA